HLLEIVSGAHPLKLVVGRKTDAVNRPFVGDHVVGITAVAQAYLGVVEGEAAPLLRPRAMVLLLATVAFAPMAVAFDNPSLPTFVPLPSRVLLMPVVLVAPA